MKVVQSSNIRSNQQFSSRVERRYNTRRMAILVAAAKVFRNKGFAATRMREIAEVADLSPGNLYHYFRGKQELLYFCQDCTLETMLSSLQTARRTRAPAGKKLRIVIEAHLRCVLDEVAGSTAHLEVIDLPRDLRRRLIDKRDRYERGIRSLVTSGIRSKEFRPSDAKMVTRAILGALNWTVRWYRPEGDRTVEEVAEEFSNYLVRGLVAGPGLQRPKPRPNRRVS